MFPQKISQNVDILARIHGNVFPWQPAIMGNKASFYQSMFRISLPWFHLSFHNACPRYLKSRRDLFSYGQTRSILLWIYNFDNINKQISKINNELSLINLNRSSVFDESIQIFRLFDSSNRGVYELNYLPRAQQGSETKIQPNSYVEEITSNRF